MIYLKYALLGIIQGLTEFLPVSSSGHLAIIRRLLGNEFTDLGLTYDVLLHLGTLLAVFIVYRKDIMALITGFFTLIRDCFRRQVNFEEHPYQKLVLLLLLASVPAALVGFLLGDYIEDIFTRHLFLVGITLLMTGLELWFSDRIVEGKQNQQTVGAKHVVIPGLFQALAIVPGLSRSGSTITGALLAGFQREFAVKFSFLMSIPVILGSALVDIIHLLRGESVALPVIPALLGVLIAAFVGYLSIKFMLKLISHNRFHYFSYYCFIIGLAVIIWQLYL